ncbi:MAG TPA: hypothetical protein VF803_03450 [Candidatus Paceibacterota bacterium]
MPQQLALFSGLRGGDWDDLTPYRSAYFPPERLEGLEDLFRLDIHRVATGQLKSEKVCPYRAGHDLYVIPSHEGHLFDDYEPVPLTLHFDCPNAHALVRDVGRRLPQCSPNRCPVRFALNRNNA